MKKRAISFLLCAALVLTSGTAAFAAAALPSDVKDTKYEAAVKALVEKDILSGYEDGAFRPANTIDRAEACTIVVKSMDPTGADLFNSKESIFTDMNTDKYAWANKYVNYAVEKGVVSGYAGKLFKPMNHVTYNEIATMLVNALGYTAKDLTGTWPSSHVNKAVELGIFKDVSIEGKGDTAATRGDVALMTATVADKIAEANQPKPPTTPTKPGITVDNGKLEDYSGRAYGMILDTAQVTNSAGDRVDQIEFLMGSKTYYLNTDGKAALPSKANYLKGNLYCLKMTDGVVKKIDVDGEALGANRFEEYTTTGAFEKVTSRSKTMVTTEKNEFNTMDDSIFYVVNFDGTSVKDYKAGSLRNIEVGDKVRAFDVTDDDNDLADIVIIVKAKDASRI